MTNDSAAPKSEALTVSRAIAPYSATPCKGQQGHAGSSPRPANNMTVEEHSKRAPNQALSESWNQRGRVEEVMCKNDIPSSNMPSSNGQRIPWFSMLTYVEPVDRCLHSAAEVFLPTECPDDR